MQQEIIENSGLTGYLKTGPIFPLSEGLRLANIATSNGYYLGKCCDGSINLDITDLNTGAKLFNYESNPLPTRSADALTMQWAGTNVKPLYSEKIITDDLEIALNWANLLIINSDVYCYRDDENPEILSFVTFANSEWIHEGSKITSVIDVTDDGKEQVLDFAKMIAAQWKSASKGAWRYKEVSVQCYQWQNIIIDPLK